MKIKNLLLRVLPVIALVVVLFTAVGVGAVTLLTDDFAGSTIDSAKWTEYDSDANVNQNEVLTIIGTNTYSGDGIGSVDTFARGDSLVLSVDIMTPDKSQIVLGYGDYDYYPYTAGKEAYYVLFLSQGNTVRLRRINENGFAENINTGVLWTEDVWYRVQMAIDDTSGATVSMYADGNADGDFDDPGEDTDVLAAVSNTFAGGTFDNRNAFSAAYSLGGLLTIDNFSVSNSFVANTAPTVASVTGTQVLDDSGDVTVTAIFDDADDDDGMTAKFEYSIDGGSNWEDPTLGASPTATTGTPAVTNGNEYQVSALDTSSGENTLTVTWNSASDVDSTTDVANAQIRITPNDGTVDGTAVASSNFALDINDPVTPTITFPESTDGETTTIRITGAEADSNLYSNSVDTEADIPATGIYNFVVTVVRGATNNYSITTVDASGNVSTPTSATIEGTAASGGIFETTTIIDNNYSIAGDVEDSNISETPVDVAPIEEIPAEIDAGVSTIDLVSQIHSNFDAYDAIIFDLFFEPEKGLTRREVLKTSMILFRNIDMGISDSKLLQLAFINNIISGYSYDGQFHPDDLTTKAEGLKMILESSGLDIPLEHGYTESPILDLDIDDWSARYILYAYDNDLIEADEYSRLQSKGLMSRAELSKIVKKISLLDQ